MNPAPPAGLVDVPLRNLVEIGVGGHGDAALAGERGAVGGAEHEYALLAVLIALAAFALRVRVQSPLQIVDRFF